ncbi:VOC family protein [Flavobacterium sp. MXW15]|uniref:VOC family protein n=1 Tax=Xanthomonas chitinilytica TaxID=2989819 RepID=A0ABT3K085_9XANT|nr:VOC family protein [Xanthomonas sp. H13-6]MCW4456424.1 VOC family protein [Flavobacterium sp. MXW15]MCW4474129.1 VOC family protein [Xanthomonas sp. H13-6]
MSKPLTCGIHHVGLAVPDLEAAQEFFCGVLGWIEVGRNESYPMVAVSDGSTRLTLWRVADPEAAVAFNRRTNIGLHHLALAVEDDAALAVAHERVLSHPGVTIEFPPGPVRRGSPANHFICAMPGGVRIEFATRRN